MKRSTSDRPGRGRVAEALGDLALQVERQPLLGAAGEEVQVAAHRPEEVVALAEQPVVLGREHALADQLGLGAHAVEVFGDPEQRVEVAQAALALLDVRLDEVSRLALPAVALVALLQLGGDELLARAAHHRLIEAVVELLGERCVSDDQPALQERGADRDVGAGELDAFIDRAGSVADLQPEIPHHVQDRLDHGFGPRRRPVGVEEQEIDVRSRRQEAAPVSPRRDHRQLLGDRWVGGRIKVLGGKSVERHNDRVLAAG